MQELERWGIPAGAGAGASEEIGPRTFGAYVTCAEAARLTGRSRTYIEKRGRDGAVRQVIQDGRVKYHAEDLARLMGEPELPSFGDLARCAVYRSLCGGIRNAPLEVQSLSRAMTEVTGPAGGYLVPYQVAQTWFDHVRSFEPLGRCRWLFTRHKQFALPIVQETSRATGSRWGGCVTRYGVLSGTDLSAPASLVNQPQVATAEFKVENLTCFGPTVSNDLLADQSILDQVIAETQLKETAFVLTDLLVGGAGYPNANLIGGPATVTVSRAGAGALAVADVDAMWKRLYGPCRRNAVWLCDDDTFGSIDALAVTEAWPYSIYQPQGLGGNPFPLLKGRPLLSLEQCPAVGNPGDLILFDPTQVGIAIHVPPEGGPDSPLMVGAMEGDEANRLLRGMERRRSSHRYFDTDQTAFFSKFRVDVKPLWSSPITPLNSSGASNTLSMCVVLSR